MKKFVLAALAVSALGFAAPAYAQSANDWNRLQQRTDPGYDLYQRNSLAGQRFRIGAYYQSSPDIGFYYDENSVRRKTWRRGGKWYKDCGNDPAIPVDQPCYVDRPRSPQGYAPSSNYSSSDTGNNSYVGGTTTRWLEGDFEFIETRYPDGRIVTEKKPLPQRQR